MSHCRAGSKAVAELRSTLYELGSPVCIGPLQVLQLAEDLRTALELQAGTEDRKAVRNQLPSATAEALLEWLESGMINHRSPVNNESYQERLSRLEGDKESLVLQVSVLTDQVEAQGEKIRDLETSLEEHHHKLSSTEEMLQQELLSRTSLETQKLDLMDEVSYLKLKLVGMEEAQSNGEDKQHKAEVGSMSGWYRTEKRGPTGNQYCNLRVFDYVEWGEKKEHPWSSLPRDDLEPTEFRRGGLRATAGPRLSRNNNLHFDFNWTKEQVCGWLEDYGLGQYVNLARQWVNSGETLLSATPQDFEKEMGIKHPLHRKKLQLAVRSFSTKVIEKSADLDHIWVTRWLDDIGLPQYKDQFNEARVDGRMLQYLTLNDLLFLKVTSQLHHLSIKSAIHVLHINKFNPNCLRRRPGDENKTSPTEVTQWSNHRVMEWLRSVDLAEYAPNLRGSGVHGGLIILEPRFNSDALAMLLNIPPQKTLLRRHLATNFNALVGTQAQQEKRQHMESSGYVPLTTTAKVRPKKLGFSSFGHLRKKKLDDSMDYICPMDPCQPALNGALRPYSGFRGLSPIFDRDAEKLEQVGQKI
uniref:PPFIA binding protein 2 n=1 Tax=Scleropages formosus TaxID=113540 RepID=A0A8C9TH82_SCLFO